MLTLRFSGWVSCRLATDPDPFDDPRGNLSGFRQLAYAGEPDLDRTIRFQNPPFMRSHCEAIGVFVKSVARGAADIAGHPLMGAAVDLLDGPVLEGRNHVIALDQSEPIFPFHFELRKGSTRVSRALLPKDENYPFPEFKPVPGGVDPNIVLAATGKQDLVADWTYRLQLLRVELSSATEDRKPGLEERIAMLDSTIAGFLPRGMFQISMRWRNALNGPVSGTPNTFFGAPVDGVKPWVADLWFGGFDADAQSFFCSGTLSIPEPGDQGVVASAMPSRRAMRARVAG